MYLNSKWMTEIIKIRKQRFNRKSLTTSLRMIWKNLTKCNLINTIHQTLKILLSIFQQKKRIVFLIKLVNMR